MRSTIVLSFSAVILAATISVGCQSSQSTGGSSAVMVAPEPASAPKKALELTTAHEFEKPGYTAFVEDGRLWVFATGSKELREFETNGELAKHVTLPNAGPARMTVKAPDRDVALAYLCTKPGFAAIADDGRVWIFRDGSEELASVRAGGELAKRVTRPAAGPMRTTILSPDSETIDAWRFAKPGFVTTMEDGRLWIFREGSSELGEFQRQGELAKHVTRPGAGPNGITVKSPDNETIMAYMTSAPGFITMMEDGRLWVFRAGSKEFAEFQKQGELAKHVTRPAAGPGRMTIKAPDSETVTAYLAMVN